jgi:hypothetical protein
MPLTHPRAIESVFERSAEVRARALAVRDWAGAVLDRSVYLVSLTRRLHGRVRDGHPVRPQPSVG